AELPAATIATLVAALPGLGPAGEASAARTIRQLAANVQSRSLRGERLDLIRKFLASSVERAVDSPKDVNSLPLLHLGASWGNGAARDALKEQPPLRKPSKEEAVAALDALRSLISGGDAESLAIADRLLSASGIPKDQVLFALSRAENPKV